MTEPKTIIEGQFVSIKELGAEVFDNISSHFDKAGLKVFERVWVAGKSGLRFRRYAGVISLSDGTRVEILPKFASETDHVVLRKKLLSLLIAVEPKNKAQKFNITSETTADIFEFNIDWMLKETEAQLRCGSPKEYVQIEEISPYIKGQLNVPRLIRTLPYRPDKNPIKYSSFTADNYIVATIIHSLKRVVATSRSEYNITKARALLHRLGNTQISPSELLTNRPLSKNNQRWQSVYDAHRNFLGGRSPVPFSNGIAVGPSVLFDMEDIFEKYVFAFFSKRYGSNVTYKNSSKFFFKKHRKIGRWFPDVILNRTGRSSVIVDAKWKNLANAQIDSADLRQVYTYCRLWRASFGALIYPTLEEKLSIWSDYSSDDSPVRIAVIGLPVMELNKRKRR